MSDTNFLDNFENHLEQATALADCLAHASHERSDIDTLTIKKIAYAISEHLWEINRLKEAVLA
jgi:hypothetical protein